MVGTSEDTIGTNLRMVGVATVVLLCNVLGPLESVHALGEEAQFMVHLA